MRSFKYWSESLSCKIWSFEQTKIRLNPKYEPSLSNIERFTRIFVSPVEAKFQFCEIFKSQNLIQFLRFGPNFLHVSSICLEVNPRNSNLGFYTTHSLTWFWKTNLCETPGLRGFYWNCCSIFLYHVCYKL